MKINVNQPDKSKKPRPKYAAVGLDAAAYDILLSIADQYGLSMRTIASSIIVTAYREGLTVDISGNWNK